MIKQVIKPFSKKDKDLQFNDLFIKGIDKPSDYGAGYGILAPKFRIIVEKDEKGRDIITIILEKKIKKKLFEKLFDFLINNIK